MKIRRILAGAALAGIIAIVALAQVNSNAGSSGGTNFGVAIGSAQTMVASFQGANATGNIAEINLSVVQTGLGTSCGAGSNTATPTVAWKGPGGTAETQALTALSVSANGTVDSFQNSVTAVAVQMGTPITFTVASTLASTGCSPPPQYTIFWRVD